MAAAAVIQVCLTLAPGGTERLVIDISKRLQGRVKAVVCLDEPGAWAPELESIGIPVVALRRTPGFHPQLGQRIAAVAREHGAKVLHCHHYSSFVYGCFAAAWSPGLRLVFTEHGRASDAPPSRKRWWVNQVFGRVPARCFAVSEDLKQHMVGEGFRAGALGVLYNGIEPGPPPRDADRVAGRALLGVPRDAWVVGSVGRLDPVKDFATLVRGFVAARRSAAEASPAGAKALAGARLVLVGDGPERASLQALVGELGAGDYVRLLGHRADVRALLPGCDVYVNTSTHEGVSLTILEAMGAALPVVATRVGGNPEVVLDGETGVLIPARDPEALAGALRRLAGDGDAAAQLGRAGRARLEAKFTQSRMVADYERAYDGA